MRRAVTPAIPSSLYRHFAVVTLVLTLGLAMLAEGENHEVQAARVAPPQPAPSATPAAFAAPSATAAPQRTPRGWDDQDADDGFGQPMQRLFSGGGSGAMTESTAAATGQIPPDYLASLSEAERERLLQGVRESVRAARPAGN